MVCPGYSLVLYLNENICIYALIFYVFLFLCQSRETPKNFVMCNDNKRSSIPAETEKPSADKQLRALILQCPWIS